MYKLTVNYLSKSGKAALVTVTRKIGFATSTVADGWLVVDEGTKKGDTLELGPDTKVTVREQTAVDEETGAVSKFNWVVLA